MCMYAARWLWSAFLAQRLAKCLLHVSQILHLLCSRRSLLQGRRPTIIDGRGYGVGNGWSQPGKIRQTIVDGRGKDDAKSSDVAAYGDCYHRWTRLCPQTGTTRRRKWHNQRWRRWRSVRQRLSSRLESEVTVIMAILTVANIKDTFPLRGKGNCQGNA
jgi:hypothetical protein